MRTLFEGGPLDGQILNVAEGRSTLEAAPRLEPARLFSDRGAAIPENATTQVVVYKIQRVVNHPRRVEAVGTL